MGLESPVRIALANILSHAIATGSISVDYIAFLYIFLYTERKIQPKFQNLTKIL